jgi:hypothetical protein
MKKILTLAAVLATFAFAQAPVLAQAADAPAAAQVEKTADAPHAAVKKVSAKLSKKDRMECRKEASAEKDGKKPSKSEEKAAYVACAKAKVAPAADATSEAPKVEENK